MFQSDEPLTVALELVAIDDDRPRLGRIGRGLRVLNDEGESLAVWRPGHCTHTTLELRHALRFTAAPIEQPHLRPLGSLTGGEKGQLFAIRAPAGRRFRLVARRESQGRRAIPACHIDVAVVSVFGRIDVRDRIRDPRTVGRTLGITHCTQAIPISDLQGTFGGQLGSRRRGEHYEQQKQITHERRPRPGGEEF